MFGKHWDDDRVMSAAIYLRPGTDVAAFEDAFRAAFADAGQFSLNTTRALRERILQVFDQTFAVTHVLRTVAMIVAIAGVFLTMTTLVTERRRELALMRALGATPRWVSGLVLAEAALLGPARGAARRGGRRSARDGAHVGGEPGVLRLDDPVEHPVGRAGVDAAVDSRRGADRRVVARAAGAAGGNRGGSARRMKHSLHNDRTRTMWGRQFVGQIRAEGGSLSAVCRTPATSAGGCRQQRTDRLSAPQCAPRPAAEARTVNRMLVMVACWLVALGCVARGGDETGWRAQSRAGNTNGRATTRRTRISRRSGGISPATCARRTGGASDIRSLFSARV